MRMRGSRRESEPPKEKDLKSKVGGNQDLIGGSVLRRKSGPRGSSRRELGPSREGPFKKGIRTSKAGESRKESGPEKHVLLRRESGPRKQV